MQNKGNRNNKRTVEMSSKNITKKRKPSAEQKPILRSLSRRRNINKKKNEQATKIFAALIFALFLFYIFGYFFVMINRVYIKTATIIKGNGEDPMKARGVIIRDEVVYAADKTGELKFLVSDLDKVKKGDVLAVIEDANSVVELKKELQDIEKEILKLQNHRGDFSVAQNDAKRINSQIKNIIDSEIFVFTNDKLENVYSLRENIEKKIDLRNKLLIEDNNSTTSNLIENRNATLKELYKNEHKITSNQGGIISYLVDNMESEYNITNLFELSKDLVNKKEQDTEIISNRAVESGESIFKLVKSNSWYIASYINSKLVLDWEESDRRNIFIDTENGYVKLDAIIEKIVPDKSETYIVFKLTKNMSDFAEKRFINFKISDKDVTGYKIPASSISEKTVLMIPKEYAIKRKDSEVYFVKKKSADGTIQEIDITFWTYPSDESNIYINFVGSPIQTGDSLVSSDDTNIFIVEKVSNIFGVYIIESGVAKYTRIYLDNILDRVGDYILLNPEQNTVLSINDEIVLDGSAVTDGEKIYKK